MWTAFLIIILSLVHSYNWLAVIICLIVQDLAKKFNETTQYKNMKQMLTSKNDQIKELRGRLRKWVIENRSCYFLLWSWKALILLVFLIFSMALRAQVNKNTTLPIRKFTTFGKYLKNFKRLCCDLGIGPGFALCY